MLETNQSKPSPELLSVFILLRKAELLLLGQADSMENDDDQLPDYVKQFCKGIGECMEATSSILGKNAIETVYKTMPRNK